MTIKTSKKILDYLKKQNEATAHELTEYLSISSRAIFKQLHNLLARKKLIKRGKPPKVFYSLPDTTQKPQKYNISEQTKKIIDDNFLIITPTGEKKDGLEGFEYWCGKHNLNITKTAADYKKTVKKFQKFKRCGLINGMAKMNSTFKTVYLDHIFYLDFYSIEHFGKTKLGQLLLYAKQSQNKKMIKILTKNIKPQIVQIIRKYKINALGFIPPTVKREVQFMKELERNLLFNLPRVSIIKLKTDIIIPQKTLNKLEDRMENAQKTIIVDEKRPHDKVLLIDDAIGSGSTLNETAAQLKNKKIAKKVIGLAITGSFKGFDVISEV